MMHLLLLALASLTLAGCAALDPYAQAPVAQRLQRDDALGDCARLFRANDALIDAAGTRDALAPRVAGFPYLRVDRALAALADAADAGPSLARQWYAALALLDDDSRRIELGNAGSDDVAAVAPLAVCRRLLARADQEEAASLREAAQVPDDYSSAMRAWGLYPLTRHAFAAGIRRWQRETVDEFTAYGDDDPARHRRQRYIVGGPQNMVPTLRQLPELGLPVVSPSALASLVARHAPTLEIETAGDDDRPGALVWRREPRRLQVGVDVNEPVLYVRTGHTRLGGRWLLQLTYAVWFAARPRQQAMDLLAGRLDGLLWRVTLDADGTALVYDTIHPCGCYHLFLPTERVRARPQVKGIEEGLFVVQTLRSPAANERVVLRLAAATHYLQRAETEMEGNDDDKAIVLSLRDDDQLRSLPLPDGGTRSAFAPDGLIAGSERLERFYFWPMGIASAGQMRQWGRHATAFVGRRHFDDPTLFDRYFEHPP
ncbi:hypothetical protein [Accumulibacter sp.]|uniref:Lipoprotein n=1 Tax=Accumulibacter regalis TaxID=522306 RepID=C7RR05_ACCRE|nr:hypothetical protein [Accumulibacter sp.]MBN8495289.1 hypothetical protein [Accumulibacter sp.]MBO3715632.1 hypothetical protein [Accumulibacter sp.]